MDSNRYATNQCFNPFNKSDHRVRDKRKLRNVVDWMLKDFANLPREAKVCDSCRKTLSSLKNDQGESEIGAVGHCDPGFSTPSEDVSTLNAVGNSDPDFSSPLAVVNTLNASLHELGESPIDKRKLDRSKTYSSTKIQKINSALKKQLFTNVKEPSDDEAVALEGSLLNNLKTNFHNTTSRNKKIMILTCLPESWSVRKIMDEFNATNYMVRQSKKILKEKGILGSPNRKPGKSLPSEVIQTVQMFYESDDISRVLPGMKDCVSVRNENGDKVKMSKRLILCNLAEAFRSFKDKFPDIKVGFSKFAELRPKHCVLAGSSGTHTVCVCTTHQNIKLMMENAKINSLTNGELPTYKHCLARILCNPPSIDCHLGNCPSCPGIDEVKSILETSFEENMIDKVSFRQWLTVDRCNLEMLEKSTSDFIDLFSKNLSSLVRHDFIAKQQSSFMSSIKENLTQSEVLVICDFAENYSFILQNEAQSHHWTNGQATVHPFVIYYKREKTEHVSFVVISECLEHNTIALYCFQKKLIEFIKSKFGDSIKKIYYFSDGSAAQYKNRKNFTNLCFHKDDFNIEAEWHFSATAHGKGPCDGVGGSVKRLAARASLQRPYENQIQTPYQLYEWAVQNIFVANFIYVTQEEYVVTEQFLENRLSKSKTIQGTQKLHTFIPLPASKSLIRVKIFSESNDSSTEKVTALQDQLRIMEISGYVTIIYENDWWLAYVLAKEEATDEVKVSFLHPAGPSASFSYPSRQDVLWLPASHVLCKVNPVTPTGRVYNLTEQETSKTVKAYNDYINDLYCYESPT